ncbi:MAG: Lrp/AsnC family transcriptional regulator [Kordiimonadaceae bacterium]|nr:Lrp/AsnC family transcriptional regulator [Kordiimonadaceae bacterium]
MDSQEKKILELLQQNGRMSNVMLAEAIGLSESPTIRRVKMLEQSGVIDRYVALLNQRAIGLQVTAFVSVKMERQPDNDWSEFHESVADEPHIVECHAMSGAYDFLMKVVARDMDHFAELVMQEILKYPGVAHVESSFSLRPIKASHALPVRSDDG